MIQSLVLSSQERSSMSSIPFYTQAALLEQYAKHPTPSNYPDIVNVVLKVLDTQEDLRQYFFRCGPSPAWARILFERGYLSEAPAPQKVQDGYRLLGWPHQIYLLTVAEQVPDVVCQHLEVVTGHPRYIALAVEALSKLDVEHIVSVIPSLIHHLEEDGVLEYAIEHADRIIGKLAKGEYIEHLFAVVEAYTTPTLRNLRPGESTYSEAQSKVPSYHLKKYLSDILDLLIQFDIRATVNLLQNQLLNALELEASRLNTTRTKSYSWWRSAIEETGQDDHKDYRDTLLEGLRDVLDELAQNDPAALEEILVDYLSSEYVILRRLGIYLLAQHPGQFVPHVREVLMDRENLSEVSIHHEFFTLLEVGTPYLNESDYTALVDIIREGPPVEEIEDLVKWRSQQVEIDEDAYRDRYKQVWVRDRLWMIQSLLSGEDAEYFQFLVRETGEPEHPAFTRWSSGGFWVRDVSAFSDDEISTKTPEQLVQFLQTRQPQQDQKFGPEQVTYRGMGEHIARLVTSDLATYSEHLAEIAIIHPAYGYAILDQLKPLESEVLSWETRLSLFERIFEEKGRDFSFDEEHSWREVRKSLISNLEVGLNEREKDKAIPGEHLSRVRDILIQLLEDPDPNTEMDRPAKGWFGHNDPSTVAINTVRPLALSALIQYARYKAVIAKKEEEAVATPFPLEPAVRQALEHKLADPSWAVRSVFGRSFPLLHWLDPDWTLNHVDEVFSEGNNEKEIWLFVAAWDSYIVFNRLYPSLFEILKDQYDRAIQLLAEGYKTESHLHAVQHLAMHLLIQYMRDGSSIHASSTSSMLLKKFFTLSSGEDRSQAAWGAWRYCSENILTEKQWKSLRTLWEWRTNEAISANHTSDFSSEINWFIRLVAFVPDTENLLTLWPLLEGVVPHVSTGSWNVGLESLEDYLANQADTYPVEVIRLYRTILDKLLSRTEYVYIRDEKIRAILEKTASSEASREATLATIDMCARQGHHQFRDIYEQYTR